MKVTKPFMIALVTILTKLFLLSHAVLAPSALMAQSGNDDRSAAFMALLRELDLNGETQSH
jgi:hypothetical protein